VVSKNGINTVNKELGVAIFNDEDGNQIFRGVSGEYNQLNLSGSFEDYIFIQRANGSITITGDGDFDRAFDIDGFWFEASAEWFSVEDILSQQTTRQGFYTFEGIHAGNIGDNFLRGTSGDDILYGGLGNDVLLGNGGANNQVNYDGYLEEYSFRESANGRLIVTHATWGRDVLEDIDGLWFSDEAAWYSVEDAISLTAGLPRFRVDINGQLNGTLNNDRMIGTTGDEYFYGGLGDDFYQGVSGFDQVAVDGYSDDFTFTIVDGRTITMSHDFWGTDTLRNIDGVWFGDEEQWYSIDALRAIANDSEMGTGVLINGVITGTNEVDDLLLGDNGDNVFYAGEAGQDRLNVDGDVIEWTFTENANSTVTMTHATWGENILDGIETILFGRSGLTFTVTDAIAQTDGLPTFRLDGDGVLNGTNLDDQMTGTSAAEKFYGGLGDDDFDGLGGFDQINYDGLRSEYAFTQNGDGTISATHAIWGTDTFTNIEGLFFNGGETEFILVADLFA